VTTAANGSYRITLPRGRYRAAATHPEYEDYSTGTGFVVVSDGQYGTFNVFLEAYKVSTVLLVHHAEPDYGADAQDPPLSSEGRARAQALANVGAKAGVKAAYATQYKRTQETVQPLATQQGLVTEIYNDPATLAASILANHHGQAVLVAGHQPSVPQTVQALGGKAADCSIGDEFDNLCLVTAHHRGKVKTVNLQYGQPSP
jgi:2,3-bisphosphoglycerate-dependent phosphoglycerate mutase